MNWKRGLVQLWVVGTLIWLAAVGTFVAADVFTQTFRTRTDKERAACNQYPEDSERYYSCESPTVIRQFNTSKLIADFPIFLGPPLVVLTLGMALSWAISGFAKRPPS